MRPIERRVQLPASTGLMQGDVVVALALLGCELKTNAPCFLAFDDGVTMRRGTFRLPTKKKSWTEQDLRLLRDSAQCGMPLHALCHLLKKSPSAVRNKAAIHGISLLASVASDSRICGIPCVSAPPQTARAIA